MKKMTAIKVKEVDSAVTFCAVPGRLVYLVMGLVQNNLHALVSKDRAGIYIPSPSARVRACSAGSACPSPP